MLKEVGFDALELDEIFQTDLRRAEAADNAPAKRETIIQPGDLFILGRHRLLCGDALNPGAIETLMAGKRAALTFTDRHIT